MANHKPVNINGRHFETIKEAAEFYSISISTVNTRLRKHWSIPQALGVIAPPKTDIKSYNFWLLKQKTGTKICRECKEEKHFKEFYILKGKTYSSICKLCAPFYNRRKEYGITREEWNKLFEDQDKKCAICGSDHPKVIGRDWHTDHDHKTNRVRGILCRSCNQLLGQAEEDIKILESAIKYLNKTNLCQMTTS